MRWVLNTNVININEYDYSKIEKIKTIKKGSGRHQNRRNYLNKFLTFDIETSRIKEIEQSFMYIWQCYDGDVCIIGRTWDEWFEFLKRIQKHLHGRYLVIYVHNLSFEQHYLSGYYEFENDEIFCLDKRKILKCDMFDSFEYRCSLQLSNMNLRTYLKTYEVDNLKTEMDYDVMRYPWDELSDNDLIYCINDVIGLHQAITKQMQLMNVNLYNIPLTSTGFVRNDIKKAMKQFNYHQMKEMQPTEIIYKLLRDAFRGGNTHANRYLANEILEYVKCYDRISSYPDVMLNHKFPMKAFKLTYFKNIQRVIDLINKGKSVLVEVGLFNVDLKDKMFGCPYLSTHKCRNVKNPTIDNGRIIKADYLETTLTDIDLKILLDIYKWDDCYVIQCAYSNYKKLPQMFRDVVMKYFINKQKLKGSGILYAIAKALLNSLYGMSCTDICKQRILYDKGTFNYDDKSIESLLEKNKKKAFTFYAWGVWTSAWARWELHKMIKECGDKFVYCDTDSVFALGDVDFTDYNKKQIEICEQNGSYCDVNGKRYYLGCLELDKDCKTFKTMGAKKYGYTDYDDNLHITIAGVNKKLGAIELAEHGGLDAMVEGFIFNESGGNDAVYNDIDYGFYEIDGHKIRITKNITIRKSSYTLGLTNDYIRLLQYAKDLKYNPKGYKGA